MCAASLAGESPAKLDILTRHSFALLALIGICAASSLWYLLDVIPAYSQSANAFGVGAFEKRFDNLRKAMPRRVTLGYLSDNPSENTQARAEFFLTQYVLAPAIIKAGPDEHFIVANLHTSAEQAKLKVKNLVKLQDYGNDIYIYQNTTR